VGARELRVETAAGQSVAALLLRPANARWLFVLGHGAGAGMRHPFLEAIAAGLAGRGMATLRYQFPYMERGSRRPDPRPRLLATVRAAIAAAATAAPDLPLLAGGKSMGGRMTSLAVSESGPDRLRGLVFLGFPLHPAGKPSLERGLHLDAVTIPLLFLQGTRDDLAMPELVRTVCERLGDRATLHFLEGADHSFRVRKRSGGGPDRGLEDLADRICGWAAATAGPEGK
jgi:predicted alpha/beta-hydrolase family hydrolase